MNIQFEQLLAQYGVTIDQLSANLKKQVQEFAVAHQEYEKSAQQLEGLDGDELDEAQAEHDDFATALREEDDEICKKLATWYKNKDAWAASAKKLADARAAKKQATASGEPTPAPTPAPAPAPAPTPTPTPAPTPAPEPTPEPEKKGTDWGFIALVAIVAGLTLGQVILKDKD
jgi:outer membrane biosynthesis protein TonB